MSHTPGPWRAYARNLYEQMVINHTGSVIASVSSPEVDYGIEEVDYGIEAANARLIAAAPDLLAALQAMRSSWLLLHRPETDEIARAVLAVADAAIAKAEGQQL